MQPAGNHQMQHQPEIAFHSDRNSLADAPQFLHRASLHICNRRLCGAKQERARQSHAFDPLPNDASFKRGHVSGDVWEFRHAL